MGNYTVKSVDQLADLEIDVILVNWNVKEWLPMNASMFRKTFRQSVFHFLSDPNGNILSLARVNNDFPLQIQDKIYQFAEFVGFVSVEKQKGHGSSLLQEISREAKRQGTQLIGFCERQLRTFYTRNGMDLLTGKARSIFEQTNGEWTPSTDDDIIVLNLSEQNRKLLNGLGEQCRAYFISFHE
ncbi:MAG: hypothetical protein ABW007_01340 [Chitinophagaceae bacterium]